MIYTSWLTCRFHDEYTLLFKSPNRWAKSLSLSNVMSLNEFYTQKTIGQAWRKYCIVNLGEKYNVAFKEIVKIMFNFINAYIKIMNFYFSRATNWGNKLKQIYLYIRRSTSACLIYKNWINLIFVTFLNTHKLKQRERERERDRERERERIFQ